ncbi:hypothetical protein [Desulfovibrio oxyclinae]|uniref:hypothetical protein n=1 Tax=Desulfovibrio oxyclinae TaxID=63560 RepID=UPI00035FF0A6|nr:hypothetical protein [Desulfovibrio oxyclinae]
MTLEQIRTDDLRELFFTAEAGAALATVDGGQVSVLRTPVTELPGGADEPDRRTMTMLVHAQDLPRPVLGQALDIDGERWLVGESEVQCNVLTLKLFDELGGSMRYAVEGIATTLVRPDGSEIPARIILERAGRVEATHGDHQQAVVKALRADFPQPPEGRLEADGMQWRLGEVLGRADGTNRYQWAVLAMAESRLWAGK